MQFNVGGIDTKFNIYTLAARQLDPSGNAVTSFGAALPIPITAPIDLTVRRTSPSNLNITHSYLCSDPTCATPASIGSFGIFGSFNNSLGVTSGAQQSGSQSITVAVIPNTTFGESEANMASLAAGQLNSIKSNASLIGGPQTLGNGTFILLCLTDGVKNASLTIGGSNGQQFTTEVKTNSVFVIGTPTHAC